MKVFLSWSGQQSKQVAELLSNWLPNVLQSIKPWFSGADIKAGSLWMNELQYQLSESKVGIICLTPENLSAPWILYEAGLLSKSIGNSFIIPYLIGFSPIDLSGPLVHFQSVTTSKKDNFKMLQTFNKLSENSINDDTLKSAFERSWPDFESKLSQIIDSNKKITDKSLEDINYKVPADLLKEIPKNSIDLLNQVIQQLSTKSEDEQIKLEGNRVFIVHGHNEVIKLTVARLVEKLGLKAIILNEQPNQGQTIIEKFETNSKSDFAVVLMTADDKGAQISKEELSFRARQNVIFELGYFTAKMGRKRLVVLYENGVEIPSDYYGIAYINIDQGGAWQFHLAKELKTAGLNVDMNKI